MILVFETRAPKLSLPSISCSKQMFRRCQQRRRGQKDERRKNLKYLLLHQNPTKLQMYFHGKMKIPIISLFMFEKSSHCLSSATTPSERRGGCTGKGLTCRFPILHTLCGPCSTHSQPPPKCIHGFQRPQGPPAPLMVCTF